MNGLSVPDGQPHMTGHPPHAACYTGRTYAGLHVAGRKNGGALQTRTNFATVLYSAPMPDGSRLAAAAVTVDFLSDPGGLLNSNYCGT